MKEHGKYRQKQGGGFEAITKYYALTHQYNPTAAPTDLGGDGELGDDDCDRVGVLGQLPGAGQLHHLFVGVSGVGQHGFGVSQALDQGLDLIEVGLLPEQLSLLEVAWQRQLGRPQEVEDIAETAETETGSVQTAELMILSNSELSIKSEQERR